MMIRKFKLVSALMAVACVFAVTASLASATFTSANYPATGSGTTTGDIIDAFGSSISCTQNSFVIDSIGGPTNTLTVTPTYDKCSAFGLPMTVNLTGCDVLAHAGETPATILTDLVCPAGITGVDIIVYSASNHATAMCHVVLHPFTNKPGLIASNSGNHVLVKGTIENMTMTQSRTNAVLCPPGTHSTTAKYTVQAAGATVVGSNGAISLS